jgi:tyrosine-protein phosphatase YwqE
MLDHYAIPLRLVPGQEVLIKPGMIGDIQAGQVTTLNSSRYLLLEQWNSTWLPAIAKRIIAELRAIGIIPVLATSKGTERSSKTTLGSTHCSSRVPWHR